MKSRQDEYLSVSITRPRARKLLIVIWIVNAGMLLTNLLFTAGWKPPINTIEVQLNMDHEACFGSWYPSFLLLLLALAGARQYLVYRDAGKRGWVTWGWWALSAVSFLISLDEVSTLHEVSANSYVKYVSPTFLGKPVSWTTLMAPFVLLVVLLIVDLAVREMGRVRGARRLALAALCFWLCAVGLETAVWVFMDVTHMGRFLYQFTSALEETSELVGTTLLLTAVLRFGFGSNKLALMAPADSIPVATHAEEQPVP